MFIIYLQYFMTHHARHFQFSIQLTLRDCASSICPTEDFNATLRVKLIRLRVTVQT